MNLYEEMYKLVKQIPRGMVSTYGCVARALGDIRAARAVGIMLNQNPYKEVPCYRVVYSDGGLGGYATGVEKKIALLQRDGIEIRDGKIDLKKYLFDDFETTYPLKRLREEQERLRERMRIEDDFGFSTVAGMDISYSKRYAYGAYVEFDREGNIIKKKVVKRKIDFPYIPTYLAYRELPVFSELIQNERPDVVMIDGNGLLHPRLFGVACHFGVVHDIPSIGIAKKKLCGEEREKSIFVNGRKVGVKVGKIYVSPGHRISVDSAVSITKRFMKYSMPEPVRQAHILANETRREDENP